MLGLSAGGRSVLASNPTAVSRGVCNTQQNRTSVTKHFTLALKLKETKIANPAMGIEASVHAFYGIMCLRFDHGLTKGMIILSKAILFFCV